jgi:hypothetical protein
MCFNKLGHGHSRLHIVGVGAVFKCVDDLKDLLMICSTKVFNTLHQLPPSNLIGFCVRMPLNLVTQAPAHIDCSALPIQFSRIFVLGSFNVISGEPSVFCFLNFEHSNAYGKVPANMSQITDNA